MTNYPFSKIEEIDDIEVQKHMESRGISQPGDARNIFSTYGKRAAIIPELRCSGMIRPTGASLLPLNHGSL